MKALKVLVSRKFGHKVTSRLIRSDEYEFAWKTKDMYTLKGIN